MTIQTKFRIGDSIWSILKGRAHGFEIQSIEIEKSDIGVSVYYRDQHYNRYPEHQTFLSKEELRDYFMGGE
ncbi:MAG: hypothetical protein HDS71_07515 [Bacteroidales bacterium]|nr:hypothetical protein [Bacteroidales bacterium]